MSRKIVFGCSLASVYLIWGSTYLAMHWALQAFPPLLLAGLRGFTAGSGMFFVLWLRGVPLPSSIECRNAAAVGVLMSLSSAMIGRGVQSVPTGTAAILVATVPIFSSLIAALCGRRVQWPEWLGIGVGLVGISLLNDRGGVPGMSAGNLTILFGALCWALGSHLSAQLRLPANIVMSVALQIMLGGAVMLAYAWWYGDQVVGPVSTSSWSAFAYLCLFGSLLGVCAYSYLVRHGSAVIANSYAYVSPVVAVLVGALLLSEKVTLRTTLAMSIVLMAVGLVFWSHYRRPKAVA